jgi:hypothetical protein
LDGLEKTLRAILKTSDNWLNRRDYSRAVELGCEPAWARGVVSQGALTDELLDLISTNMRIVAEKYSIPTQYAPETALVGAVAAYVVGRMGVARAIRDKAKELKSQPKAESEVAS